MTIHQKFTGDVSQLLKCYQDVAAQSTRMEQQIGKLSGTMGDTGRVGIHNQNALNAALRVGQSEVQALAQQWGGLAGVIVGVKMDLDEIIEKQGQAAKTNIAAGGSQADIIRNLPGVGSDEKKKFLQDTQTAFAKSQFPDLNEFNRAVASGLSASAGDTEGTLRAAQASALLTRDKPQELDLLVGAALDIKKASGVVEAERNLGFMLQVGGESRMVDTRQNAINIPPAIIAAVNSMKGDRRQTAIDAGAVFAAVGSQAADVRGEATSTAVTSLAVQARDYFEKGIEKTVHGQKFRLKPKVDPGTFEGRISYLQDNEKDRKRFLENANFERKFQVPIEQLLTAGSETDLQFRSSRKKINFDDREFKQQASDLQNLTSATKMASVDAASKGMQQLAELDKDHDARIVLARELRNKALSEARQYSPAWFGTRNIVDYGENAYEFSKALEGRNPVEDAVKRVERRRQDLLQPASLVSRDYLAFARKPEDLNADERRTLEFLDGQLALLRQLLEADQAAAKAREEQTQLLRQIANSQTNRQPSAIPAARAERGRNREQ